VLVLLELGVVGKNSNMEHSHHLLAGTWNPKKLQASLPKQMHVYPGFTVVLVSNKLQVAGRISRNQFRTKSKYQEWSKTVWVLRSNPNWAAEEKAREISRRVKKKVTLAIFSVCLNSLLDVILRVRPISSLYPNKKKGGRDIDFFLLRSRLVV